MKAFLMSKNADFNPERDIPSNSEDLVSDLELDTLFDAMADGDDFLRDIARSSVLTGLDDVDTVKYRQDALRDCMNHPDIIRTIYNLPLTSIERKRDRWLGIHSKYPASILSNAVKMIDMFLDLLAALEKIAVEHSSSFESESFSRFFDMVKRELGKDYLAEIANRLKELAFRDGVLLSAELGKGNEPGGYTLARAEKGGGGWLEKIFSKGGNSYSFQISPRDVPGATALAELKDEGVRGAANSLAKSAEHIESFFNTLRVELAFYICCLNLVDKLNTKNMNVCIPDVMPVSDEVFNCEGFYDPCLALTTNDPIVPNKVAADGKRLVMITGANQGGKSTFIRSVGVASFMSGCGMFAPADSLSISLTSAVFTHFKREEDSLMKSGKLDEELARMSSIVDSLKTGSLLLMNESFASTNEREGSEIATWIVDALMEQGVRVFYVTHFFELADSFYGRKLKNALFLRSEREADGKRSFKLVENGPLQTSFAEDIYQRVFKH
ncbi:MAG: DNA mismatch repair protein MutS [Kiritimatiellaeota bacterium]|nr:DNA mismatch repair protein MutS [Kiritimatiellota bacterium]